MGTSSALADVSGRIAYRAHVLLGNTLSNRFFKTPGVVTASIAAFFIGEDERKMRGELHHDIRELRKEVHELRAELTAYRDHKDNCDKT